jgi:hypothetical protein
VQYGPHVFRAFLPTPGGGVQRSVWNYSCGSLSGCIVLSELVRLFSDVDLGIQFLKDVGLIRSKVT